MVIFSLHLSRPLRIALAFAAAAARPARQLLAVLTLAAVLLLAALSGARAQQGDLLVNEFGPISRYNTAPREGHPLGERLGYLVSPEPDPIGGLASGSWGFTFGPDGLLYVGDFSGARVLRYEQDPSGTVNASYKFKDVFLDAGINGLSPGLSAIAFGPDGNFYVSAGKDGDYDAVYSTLFCFDGKSAAPLADFFSLSGIDLVFGADGTYASNWWENSVERLRVTRDPATNTWQMTREVIIAPGDNGLSSPRQIAFGPDGNLYITSEGEGSVKRYHHNGISWEFTGDVAVGSGAIGLAFGPSDNCLYTLGGGQILRYQGPNYDVAEVFADGVGGSKLLFDRFRTPTGTGVAVSPIPTTTLTFDTVGTGGVTTVTPLNTDSTRLPENFKVAPSDGGTSTYFEIESTVPAADIAHGVELSIAYKPEDFPNGTPLLLHDPSDNGSWSDNATQAWITKYGSNVTRTVGGSTITILNGVDSVNHKIYGYVTSFSPFAIVKRLSYSWSGVLQPVNADGTSIFKKGSTVPVKFKLTGVDAGLTDLHAQLYLSQADTVEPTVANEAVSTGAADSGNTFRYDAAGRQYLFNLSTRNLPQGTWYLRIDLGDGKSHIVRIKLKN